MDAFAAFLLRKWDAAAAAGAESAYCDLLLTVCVLRSSASDAQQRVLDGTLQLLIQYNPVHGKKKRPADQQLLQGRTATEPPETSAAPRLPPSTAEAFNFTKIRRNEVLCGLSFSGRDGDGKDHKPLLGKPRFHALGDVSELPRHAVLINVSPLMRGHSLLVLDLPLIKPQKLDIEVLQHGISIIQAMQEPQFALGFNSAGAWSSVNHFHLQGFFMDQLRSSRSRRLPILDQTRRELFRAAGSVVVYEFPDWPMHCYGIGVHDSHGAEDGADSISTPERALVDTVWSLVERLQARNTPHNMLIASASPPSSPSSSSAALQPLVIVFPRQHQRENGSGFFNASESDATRSTGAPGGGSPLRFAIAELSGLVVAGDDAAFQHFTQDMFVWILENEISLAQV